MSAFRRLWYRLRTLRSRTAMDREFDAERESHLELAADGFEQQGANRQDALRRAQLAFGTRDSALDLQRDERGWPRLENLMRDFRFGLRSLRRTPGLTAVVILILAIGIGANTAVFSLVRPVMLAPLPFQQSESLVWVSNTGTAGLSGMTFQVTTFEALAARSRTLKDWTAYFAFFGFGNDALTGHHDPERIAIVDVGPRFFEILGVTPAAGRHFTPAEHLRNRPDVVLMGHGLWTRRFASDPAIVGRSISINNLPVLVAGVLPATFDFASVFAPGTRADLFRPAIPEDMRPWGNTLAVVARLSDGATVASAQTELDAVARSIADDNRDLNRFGVRVSSLADRVSGSIRGPLTVLWLAVGLVLLIACVNVSNLLLARSSARTKEFAVRLALGAGKGRIVQQLLVEGVTLACFGAAAGIPLAVFLTRVVKANAASAVPLLHHADVDGFALAVTAAIAVGTGIIFSLLPSVRLARANPGGGLTEQSRGSTAGRRHVWVRSALAITQVALACVLLVGAGLLLRSLSTLLDADFGFQPAGTSVLSLKVGQERSIEERARAFTETARLARSLPGVAAAGLTDALPLDRNRSWGVRVPGRTYAPGTQPVAFGYVVGPGYFPAMGIRVMAGRDFAETDTPQGERVAIVSQSLARAAFPEGGAMGGRLQIRGGDPVAIVGIVADARQSSLDNASASQLYLPYTQGWGAASDLVIRSGADSGPLVARLRQLLPEIDKTLIVTEVKTVGDLVERSVSPRRFLATLITGFSVFAAILASLGIYGVVSFGVSERVQEIGVRMALGASGGEVRRHVLKGTLKLAGAGIAIGLLLSLGLGRLIGSLLYGTSPADPMTFGSTAGLLLLVAAMAGLIPALRASRIAPMRALQR